MWCSGSRPAVTAHPRPMAGGGALPVMAHNLGRAVGQLAGPDLERATAATLQRKIFTIVTCLTPEFRS